MSGFLFEFTLGNTASKNYDITFKNYFKDS